MDRAVYRIIDANFNRAREAARVIEEFCRFALNSAPLTERARKLRSSICACLKNLDTARLIACRDTTGDVGAARDVDKQLQRANLNDSFTAACKRLSEALRTLAEMTQILDSSCARTIEELRFAAYTLEKDIVVFSSAFEKFKPVKLYIVITSNLPAEVLSLTQRCVQGGADCIQLRAKNIEDDKLFALAAEFVGICKQANVLSIINDRVDIAVATAADGVHLGQNDLPVEQARSLELSPLIIGKSTHSLKQLRHACEQPLTYVSLGPVFATATKPTAEAVGLDYVKQATEILADTGIAGVAIGGITEQNVKQVLKAGAEKIAVCSAVTEAPNPADACRKLKAKIESLQSQS